VPDVFVRFQPNLEFLDRFFIKVANIEFHGNPSSGNRAHTRGQKRTDGHEASDVLFAAILTGLKNGLVKKLLKGWPITVKRPQVTDSPAACLPNL
jgi:hypothetical protein